MRRGFLSHKERTDESYPWQGNIFRYERMKGRRFCEIGIGQGEQFARYCEQGPELAVGVDFSLNAARLTQKRLEVFGLDGLVVVVAISVDDKLETTRRLAN